MQMGLPFLGKSNWFTTMLCVSISYAVSSCTRRSVSYSDRNSEMQTQTKVVFSYKAHIYVSERNANEVSFSLV